MSLVVKKPKKHFKKKRKMKLKTLIKKEIAFQQELKRFDGGITLNTITNTPGLQDLFLPAQGVQDVQRVGDTVELCGNMEFIVDVYFNSLSANLTQLLRLIIFQWHPNSVPNTPANTASGDILILTTISQPATPRVDPVSQYNMDTRQEYHILWDKMFVVNTATSGPQRFCYKKLISTKKCQKHVQFSNTGTVGTNKIYALQISSETVAGPSLRMSSRIYYRDS